MAGEEPYDAELPEEFSKYLDFVSNSTFVLFGFAFYKLGLIKDVHLPGMQCLVFTVVLPLVNVGVLWTTTLKTNVIAVLGFSAVMCTFSAGLALLASRWAAPSRRGFYLMAGTANALTYSYPVLLRSPKFGISAIPVVVMWELGGNLLTAALFHGIVAQAYAPDKQLVDSRKVLQDPLYEGEKTPRERTLSTAEIGALPPPPEPVPEAVGSTDDSDESNSGSNGPSEDTAGHASVPHKPSRVRHTWGSLLKGHFRNFGIILARTPLFWGVIIGLLLNVTGAPFTALPGRALRGVTSAFAPLLYVLLGANLRFNLGRSSWGLIFKALAARTSLNIVCGLIVYFVFPFDYWTKMILLISLACPMTSTFVMYASQHGYRMDEVAITKNCSDLFSLIVLSVLAFIA